LYWNEFSDVRDFLNELHGDKHMIYNLCKITRLRSSTAELLSTSD
jgi:hypothetical protein